MKRMCLLVVGIAALTLTANAQLGQELIDNGAMSKLNSQGWPIGWPQGRQARVEKDAQGNRLVLEGANAGVNFKIPLKIEYGQLTLTMKMKVTGVVLGKESWQTGRFVMSYHDAKGNRVGEWPNVFGLTGTTDWIDCERVYSVPTNAAYLQLGPCNLGASGTVEFRHLSLTVSRMRALVKADAALPPGAEPEPWVLKNAWRQTTPTRERLCLNGLWGFRPVMKGEDAERVPAAGDCWGWFKVPGIWPNSPSELSGGTQRVWLAPWLEENGGERVFDQAWYKRKFTVPESWNGRRIALDFTMLQTHAKAFVDGVACGELWYPGGELELSGRLPPGTEHELALLVTARPLTAERNAFMAPDRIITDKANVHLKGITGDLFLCAMPSGARLEDAQVITSVKDRSVTFVVETAGLGKGPYRLRAEVTGCAQPERVFEAQPLVPDAAGLLRMTASWTDAKRWDTDTPQNRYSVSLSLSDAAGKVLDTLTPVAFGFREIRAVGRDFMLNGTPIHLRALHNTSANGDADKATATAARELCHRMFSYGFNAIIGGNYDFAPGSVGYLDGLLEACDETGMLLAFSLPHKKDFGNQLDDPKLAELYRKQTAWLIRRARNHPSVILYAMNHNSTGYYGDQNPMKMDGVYDVLKTADLKKNDWVPKQRKQALITDAIAKSIDPTRPVYHHESGNLGDLHTVNCYLNWAPLQERSDWTEHWSSHGVKPLFFVEWGLPHVSSWSSYRGPKFIWRCEAFQSLWAAEFAAQFWGDAAYRDDEAAIKALDHEEALWAAGKPFAWSTLNRPLRNLTQNYQSVQAYFGDDNWRSHRAWGVSAMLPWDQGDFWNRVSATPTADLDDSLKGLKCPGIVPDRITSGGQFIQDLGLPGAFEPSVVGRMLLRWNMPDCAFIGGPVDAFTAKGHLYAPGVKVSKSLVVLNDRRRVQTVEWTWQLWQRDGKLLEKRGSSEVPAGGKTVVPVTFPFPENAQDGDNVRLTARFVFGDGVTQTDEQVLRAVTPPQKPVLDKPVLLYDPHGLTASLFDRLHVPYRVVDGTCDPGTNALVVIGREALDEDGAGISWMAKVPDGLRVLVFEQRAAVLEGALGFRIAERGARCLFPRFPHPVTQGLEAACFRDWSGSATLLTAHLHDLPELETHDPKWRWCGFENTRVWRCGSRGNVASVLIEKPAKGDWRILVDGEFDMQYAALLENVEGRGRVVFCQLDVTGRTETEPVADRLVVSLVNYLAQAARPEARRSVVCAGEKCQTLVRDLGVTTLRPDAAYGADTLLVAGPGAVAPAGLAQAVAKGLNVVCLGLNGDELRKWCPGPVTTVRTNACFSRIEKVPSELRGLCNADWAWHGRMTFDALLVPDGERTSSSSALRVIRHGQGRVVVWQVPPWMIDETAKPYLRTSKRHANAMAARLLANLGAELHTPLHERFLLTEEKEWLKSYYLDVPEAGDDPYRYYRW